jgi:hypothetical protein
MKTTYSYKFTHHTNSVTTDYKFVVYCVYSPAVYDVIDEFNGLEALKHYKAVQETTPEQLQKYLARISKKEYSHNSHNPFIRISGIFDKAEILT